MEIVRRKVNELKATEYNLHMDLRTGTVVGGHQRLKAMKDHSYEEIKKIKLKNLIIFT